MKKIFEKKRIANVLRYLVGAICVLFVQNIITLKYTTPDKLMSRVKEITSILEDNYYET